MIFADKTIQLAQRVAMQLDIPPIISIVLPEWVERDDVVDEFGFVILRDGSIGPFYVSLDDSLRDCHRLYPEGQALNLAAVDLVADLTHSSQARRAIALGAFNAISQHVFRCANYVPEDSASIGSQQPKAGQTVGMVGYFKRLIKRLRALDVEVLVLEKNPQRVDDDAGVRLTTQPKDLQQCDHILCTASTLINGTLESLLQQRRRAASFSLIGPSGSGLPDILFELGVDSVGGVMFRGSAQQVIDTFNDPETRGKTGHKYQITAQHYPGIEDLLKACYDAPETE
jgi:uncharacterized protein (DUF4213/DUF364 family)